MKYLIPNSICINICTSCNLKCTWCYEQGKETAILKYDDFQQFFRQVIDGNVECITLLGGEATTHPDFIKILNLLKQQSVYLVTNGIEFSDKEFADACMGQGIAGVSVSLKGYSDESFKHITKSNFWEKTCQAIQNINKLGCPVTYTYSYAQTMNCEQMGEFKDFLIRNEIDEIIINDLRPYYGNDGSIIKPLCTEGLEELVSRLEEADISVYLRLNHPLCNYSDNWLQNIREKGSLITQCAVKKGGQLFFSPHLELVPCNEFYEVILGKFLRDFSNYDELIMLWNSHEIRDFYTALAGCPQYQCKLCNKWSICGGSCILHWL